MSGFDVDSVRRQWETVQSTASEVSTDEFTLDKLNDDYQSLFVHMVLDHVDALFTAWETQAERPAPLRLFLLGTAGTGKTSAVKTLLSELLKLLKNKQLPATFVRVAAPTGSAAFNIRFRATTIHRLIHWFRPQYFTELRGNAILDLQEYLQHTELLISDEVSIMGRFDSRLHQGKPNIDNPLVTLSGTSTVCVSDPAQCEAIADQQI